MFKQKKYFLILGFILLMPFFVNAQEINLYQNLSGDNSVKETADKLSDSEEGFKNNIFKAKVIEILAESEKDNSGNKVIQQDLKLIGLDGDYKGQEIIFNGIGDLEIGTMQNYKKGDRVLISYDQDSEGETTFYIVDSVRTNYIYFLLFLFILVILVINRWTGLRALFSLLATFLIILKFIMPQILNGANPIFISLLGGLIILMLIIYITEGWNRKSHLAIFSIFITMIIIGILAVIFSNLMKLSGLSEESVFLVNLIGRNINFKGILFAGVIIGSLGILDDMVVSQISAVQEIKELNINNSEVFKKAYRIGMAHIGSMTNTLFLAYTGSSLTILLLFSVGGMNFNDILNNNMISVEIFRSLIGAIGLALSMPISTYLEVKYLNSSEKSSNNL